MRSKLPKTIEAEILFLNRHTCCICREKNKDVQIHHIDGRNGNNTLSNLAILCLDCHSKVTGKRGLGKSFSKSELRRYKKNWENSVKKEFGLSEKQQSEAMAKTLRIILSKVVTTENILKHKRRNGKLAHGDKLWRLLDSFARMYIRYLKRDLAKRRKEKAEEKITSLSEVVDYAKARLEDDRETLLARSKDLGRMRSNTEKLLRETRRDLSDIEVFLTIQKKLYLFTFYMSHGLGAMRSAIEQGQKNKEQIEKSIKSLNTFCKLLNDDICKHKKGEQLSELKNIEDVPKSKE